MTMGQRLLALRTRAGLSQEALAEQLGVSRQSISKWETDGSIPDLDKLVRLSEIFGVTLDELVKGKQPRMPHLRKEPYPLPCRAGYKPFTGGTRIFWDGCWRAAGCWTLSGRFRGSCLFMVSPLEYPLPNGPM